MATHIQLKWWRYVQNGGENIEMYVQITTRCNMSCAHCCMSATAKGKDMSIKTFRNVLHYCDGYISIGGGEPTLHKLFWQFLCEAIGSCEAVWLATNGSKTDIALTLAKMAKTGTIQCALSQDAYHDPIDPKVVDAFTVDKNTDYYGYGRLHYEYNNLDSRSIRNVTNHEINAGRCDFGEDGCVCPELLVKPNGDVKLCGCVDAPFVGNVNTGLDIPLDFCYGECWKRQPDTVKEEHGKNKKHKKQKVRC